MKQPTENVSQLLPPAWPHPPVDDFIIPLHLLPSGEFARIDQLVGDVDQVHRLEEMGLRSGTIIEMVQAGMPCIIKLAGHKLCFRNSEACNVLVRPGAQA